MNAVPPRQVAPVLRAAKWPDFLERLFNRSQKPVGLTFLMKTPLFTGVISFSTKEKGALNILGINTVEDFLALDLENISGKLSADTRGNYS